MFCPNCGTENDDSATTCKKCGFNLKGAAAPKFKGTMLMMNQQAPRPGAPNPPGPAAPGPAPAGGVPGAPPNFGGPPAGAPGAGMPTGPRAHLKGTMLGVAPPSLGAQVPPPAAAPAPMPAPAQHSPAGFGAPPPAGAPAAPGGFQGGAVNPLGGTMVADPAGGFNPYGQSGGPYGAPPPQAAAPVAPPPGFGAPTPPQGNFGGPPPGGGFGAPPAQGGFGGPPGGGFPPPGGGYGAPPPQGYGAPAGAPPAYQPPGHAPQQGFGAPSPGYSAPGGAMVAASGQRGAVGKTRNPVMVLLIGWLCFVYAFIEGAAMLKELRAFRGKQDINLLFFLIPILNLIEIWKLPAKVLEAKQMAGVPNAQVAHPILYLLLGFYFLPADLNEVWQAAGGGQQR